MGMVNWLDDGIHVFTTDKTGVYVAKRPWKAIISSGASGRYRDGLVATASGTLIVRDCQVRHNRYYGLQGDPGSKLIADHCWIHQNMFVGIGNTYSASPQSEMIVHRCLVENNGSGWQFCHGIYDQSGVTNGGKVRQCIVRGNEGWQVQASSSGTGKIDVEHSVLAAGRYSMIWHSSYSGNQTTDRVTMLHPYTIPAGQQSASGASIVYNENDLRLRMNNGIGGARLYANGLTIQDGDIVEDETTADTFYRSSTAAAYPYTTVGATRAGDTGANWTAFTDMPIDVGKGFYWPDSSTTVGAYDVGPDLNDSLNLWPNGMFAQMVHAPTPRCEWYTPPCFPEDFANASTACGEVYHRCAIDIKITGVTGTYAANWNTSDYATVRLPPSIGTQNQWGIVTSGTFDHLEQDIPGYTTGDTRITMSITANADDTFKWSLAIEVNGTQIDYEVDNVKIGPIGDSASETFVTIPLKGGSGTTLNGAEFSGATISFLSQVS